MYVCCNNVCCFPCRGRALSRTSLSGARNLQHKRRLANQFEKRQIQIALKPTIHLVRTLKLFQFFTRMSAMYGSAAAHVVYGSHYGGTDGPAYFSRKQLKRAIKYGSYFGGVSLGAPIVTAPALLYDVESRYYFEGGYRSSKHSAPYFHHYAQHYAPYFHHYAPQIGGINVSSAVSSAQFPMEVEFTFPPCSYIQPVEGTVKVHANDAVDHQSLVKAKALLEKFVGCEDFKSKMQQLERSAAELRKLGLPVDDLLSNWLFVGEPRTGMVAPSASLRVLAGVTRPSHVFTCFFLHLAYILAF
jgi:hypothetical protein